MIIKKETTKEAIFIKRIPDCWLSQSKRTVSAAQNMVIYFPSNWTGIAILTNVKTKLREYHKNGFKIVFITNQKGLGKKKTGPEKIAEWKKKVNAIIKKIKVPICVFALLQNDIYRKPKTTIWDQFIKYKHNESFYCGDAAGRPERVVDGSVYTKDFYDSDYSFKKTLYFILFV